MMGFLVGFMAPFVVAMSSTDLTIGGSEAASACGLDPYRSRVRLFLEKTGQIAPREAGESAEWGNLLQPVIAAQVESRGYAVMPAPADPYVDGFRSGHLDGFAGQWAFPTEALSPPGRELEVSRGVLEVKTAGFWTSRHWNDDECPPASTIQCHHYMHLTGLDWSLLACLIGGQRLELRVVKRDERLMELMLAAEQEFYDLCVAGTPPPPDGSKDAGEMLKHLYPRASGGIVEFSADTYAKVLALKEARSARKKWQAEEEGLEQEIKTALGENETGLYEGQRVVSWANVEAKMPAREEHLRSYRRFLLHEAVRRG